MTTSKKILKILDNLKVKYEVLKHKTVFTGYDLAQTLRRDVREIAKTLVVKADEIYVLVVLPASRRLDLEKLKKFLKAKRIEIAKEGVMNKVFKIKPGAIVPFAKLYKNVPIYADKALLKVKKVIAGAGSYEDSVELKTKDFFKASGAKIGQFSQAIKKQAKKIAKKKGKK